MHAPLTAVRCGVLFTYVRLWDTTTCREEPKLRGFIHTSGGVAFSPDGKRLAVGCSSSDKPPSPPIKPRLRTSKLSNFRTRCYRS